MGVGGPQDSPITHPILSILFPVTDFSTSRHPRMPREREKPPPGPGRPGGGLCYITALASGARQLISQGARLTLTSVSLVSLPHGPEGQISGASCVTIQKAPSPLGLSTQKALGDGVSYPVRKSRLESQCPGNLCAGDDSPAFTFSSSVTAASFVEAGITNSEGFGTATSTALMAAAAYGLGFFAQPK
mgnify:CR=1 FL=1